MGHAERPSRSLLRMKARADRLAVDLILDCERAASRRNPRDCDPTRWSKTAWRRYLYAAAHAPSLVDLERVYSLDEPMPDKKQPPFLDETRAIFMPAIEFNSRWKLLGPTPNIRPFFPHHILQPPGLPSALRSGRMSLSGIHPSLSLGI